MAKTIHAVLECDESLSIGNWSVRLAKTVSDDKEPRYTATADRGCDQFTCTAPDRETALMGLITLLEEQ